jgi:hypothetical protein
VCWDPFTEEQINAIERVQKEKVKYADLTNETYREILAQFGRMAALILLSA